MPESPVIAPPANNLLLSEALLGVKLYIPRTPASLVSRPQLMARLNAGLQRLPAAALISAPPGFGKTTLISSWIYDLRFTHRAIAIYDLDSSVSGSEIVNPKSKIQNSPVAWLSLDEGDNDPHRFLAYVAAALQTIQPEAGQRVLAELQRRSTPSAAIEPLLTPLLNEVAAIPGPLIFVLDDYHAIKSPSIHSALTFLLNNLPPQLYLVIASRTEPPLPLARLRSRGQLIELHSADLSFTPAETAQFLNQVMGLQLAPEEVSALEARTEGWVAGLQMAALSMQGLRDTASFVKAFTGSHRYILDYLLEEVLQRQPLPVQKFLLQTSILARLTGPLCDAITEIQPVEGPSGEMPGSGLTVPAGIDDTVSPGQKLLWQLEQNNLFIIPLDDERRWYRYHQLFADALYHRLELTIGTNEEVARLHRRASHWYEQNGFTTEAMQHALAALDTVQVVRLVKQKAAGFLSRSELITLLSWLDNLPQEFIRSHSRAALLSAWAMVLTGQLEAVEPHLQTVEQALETDHAAETDAAHLKGEISTIRAAMAYFRRDMAPAIELFNRALALLSPDNLFLQGAVLHTLGAAYSWQGNVSQASRTFIEAANVSQATGNLQVTLIALGSLAQMQLEQGHLRQAGETYQEALQRLELPAEPEQLTHASTAARLYIGLAELLYHRNELEQAQRQLKTGINLAQAEQGSGTLAGGYLLLARLRQAQGNTEGALEAVRRAAWLAQQYTGPYYWITEVAVYQARLWLAQDNLKAVELWAGERGLWPVSFPETIPYLREGEYLILARLLLAQARQPHAQAIETPLPPLTLAAELLAKIAHAAQETNRLGRLLEVLILQALILQVQSKRAEALAVLDEALSMAMSEGYIRLFVDEGPAMADLLRQAKSQSLFPECATRLISAFTLPAAPPIPLLDPLSERELEILRLIATGMSNKVLAETLFLTIGTVKWHLNNIYSKLDVRSRTHAVARARELGLL